MKILLLTVGGSCEPLVTSIKMHKPNFVFFLCSDDQTFPKKTTGSYITVDGEGYPCIIRDEEAKPSIVSQTNLKDDQYKKVIIPNIDGIFECYGASFNTIAEARERFPQAKIIADYTGGTKTMSAGMLLAALDDGEVDLYLVGGERLDLNKVRSGSQMVMKCNWMPLIWKRRFSSIESLFKEHDYNGCLELIEEAAKDVEIGSREQKVISVYKSLSHCFLEWDRFNHEEALTYLEPYASRYKQYVIILKRIINTKLALAGDKKGKTDLSPVYDLLLNGKRRIKQRNYDDAAARLYRSLELLAQLCLLFESPPLYTRDIDVNSLPDDIREKYESMREVKPDENDQGIVQLSLLKSYELLYDLKHPLGEQVMKNKNKILNFLSIRNQSILAHGFVPIEGIKVEEFYDFLVSLVKDAEEYLKIKEGFDKALQFPEVVDEKLWSTY